MDEADYAEINRLEALMVTLKEIVEFDTPQDEEEYVLTNADFLAVARIWKKVGSQVNKQSDKDSQSDSVDHQYQLGSECRDIVNRVDLLWKNMTLFTAMKQNNLPKTVITGTASILPVNIPITKLVASHQGIGPCPLCPLSYLTPQKSNNIRRHLSRFHMKHCIVNQGYRLHLCKRRDCSRLPRSHYHCLCGRKLRCRMFMASHVLTCMEFKKRASELQGIFGVSQYGTMATGSSSVTHDFTLDDSSPQLSQDASVMEPLSVSPSHCHDDEDHSHNSPPKIFFKPRPSSTCNSCGQAVPESQRNGINQSLMGESSQFDSSGFFQSFDQQNNASIRSMKVERQDAPSESALGGIKEVLLAIHKTLNTKLGSIEERLDSMAEATRSLESRISEVTAKAPAVSGFRIEKKRLPGVKNQKIQGGPIESLAIIQEGHCSTTLLKIPEGSLHPEMSCPLCFEGRMKLRKPRYVQKHLKEFHEKHSFVIKGRRFLLCRLTCFGATRSHYHCTCSRIIRTRSLAIIHIKSCTDRHLLLTSSHTSPADWMFPTEVPSELETPKTSTKGYHGDELYHRRLTQQQQQQQVGNMSQQPEPVSIVRNKVILESGDNVQVFHMSQEQLEQLQQGSHVEVMQEDVTMKYEDDQAAANIPSSMGMEQPSYQVIYMDEEVANQ